MIAEADSSIRDAITNTRAHLLSLRNADGFWEGELSSSALSTATAIVALHLVDSTRHADAIAQGVRWLFTRQNIDGGWGDTTSSKSNLSTTLLCWSAMSLCDSERAITLARCETWIKGQTGSLEPAVISKAVVARYGKDRTFSVPILMMCALCGRLGIKKKAAWKRVLALPFELAAMPRGWFGAIGLPVVSYALPALIAIGHARYHHAPPSFLNPLRWLRGLLWRRIRPMLKTLQPQTGGYLEATPLTSFVTMALAGSGEADHPCVPEAVRFIKASQRADGSWPIDTNLATWGTTLAVKAMHATGPGDLEHADLAKVKKWLLRQQYQVVHPFTNAAPGGWAWTDLPGGVPDADDTSGALVALWHLCTSEEQRNELVPMVEKGITWLLNLQNRDGGIPTFCRGWGTLPFDRSTPEITAHAMQAWSLWHHHIQPALRARCLQSEDKALAYLTKARRSTPAGTAPLNGGVGADWSITSGVGTSWEPLWFGNEQAEAEINLVFGTAAVLKGLVGGGRIEETAHQMLAANAARWLATQQHVSGGWGGGPGLDPTIEETAMAVEALAHHEATMEKPLHARSILRGTQWLLRATRDGTKFPAAPLGLYFARLWYHEKMYPVVWTLGALKAAERALRKKTA